MLDAVEVAIKVLEDSPHFNAGTGAVAGVDRIKNPIAAARKVIWTTS